MGTERGQVQTGVKRWPEPLLWHSEVHGRWGQCTLQFWLLRLREMYDKEEMFDQLVDLLEDIGVGAYTAYELAGPFDVLLRAWIPSHEVNGFEERLKKTLPLEDKRQFTVSKVLRHWPWVDDSSFEPRPCDVESLQDTVTSADIGIINRLSDQGHRNTTVETSTQDFDVLERLMEKGAVTDIGATTGIRLFLKLKGSEGLSDDDWAKLQRGVMKQLDKVTRLPGDEEASAGGFTIDDVSLYACNDRSLVVLCRIPFDFWFSVRENLLEPLASMAGIMQTTTLPSLSQHFVRSREWLFVDDRVAPLLDEEPPPSGGPDEDGDGSRPVPPAPRVPPGVRKFLEGPEDKNFEAKGSAFTPLEEWLSRPGKTPDSQALKESKGFFRDTIAKTVVAMLNTAGGTLVIGVLEKDRFAKRSAKIVNWLSELPTAGGYFVLGLQDPVFRSKEWDGFELKFNRLLKEFIEGEMADLVHVSRGWVDQRALAVVQVEYRGMDDGYYLLDEGRPRFMVRRGGSTDELKGPQVTRYIERMRRKDRSEGPSA